MRHLLKLLAAALLITPTLALATPPADCAQVTPTTCWIHRSLKRGINFGNMLDAPQEGDWGIRLDPTYIDIAAEKFQTVRLPVRWSNHATPDASATIDPVFLARVTQAVDALLARNLFVILDAHHYSQIFGDSVQAKETAVSADVLDIRLVNIWKQLGAHFKIKSPKLIFELLNEPHGRLDATAWTARAPKLVAAVRETNPERVLILGPTSYNSARGLASFVVPKDKRLIIALHDYDPFNFTHQGIKYLPMSLPAGVSCCSDAQKAELTKSLEVAHQWSLQNGYPIHLGEFGSYQVGDMDSRAAYTRFARSEAERLGMTWAYWEFGSSFGVYSPSTKSWISPLIDALLD
jgi:endoglucanase